MKRRLSNLKKICVCMVTATILSSCAGADENVTEILDDSQKISESVVVPTEKLKEEDAVIHGERENSSTEDLQGQIHIEEKEEINEEEAIEETTEKVTEIPEEVMEESEESGVSEPTGEKSSLYKTLDTLPTDAEIRAMSSESGGWGQGTQTDANNRPEGCLQYEEKYGSHAVRFIKDDGDEKNIYLTFDEGYENGYTPAILDTLKEKNVKAVFFITMDYARKEPELVQRMIDEGHVVGNHSVTHPSAGLPSQTLEVQENEVMELHNYVKDNFGYEMYLFRFPAGIFSEQSLGILDKCGYTGVFWSFAYHDWDPDNQMANSQALNKTLECLHPGAVYLLHAVSSTNSAILGDFIDATRAEGYTFK